jgi:hypothetical protein
VTVTKVHGLAVGSAMPDAGVTVTKVHGVVVLSPAVGGPDIQRLFMIMA